MDDLETGKDKIKKICEILKNESLEPAKDEAQKVVEVAQEQARTIIRDAESKAEDLLKKAGEKFEKERALFETSLQRAAGQAIESLKQAIEEKLFSHELVAWLDRQTADPKLAADLVAALVSAVDREGTSADFSALIPASVPAEKVTAALGETALAKLREGKVEVGNFAGGAQLRLHDQKLTLDLSDEALKELLGTYVRKDFRARFFQ